MAKSDVTHTKLNEIDDVEPYLPRYNAETEAAIEEGRKLAEEVKEGKRKGFSSVREMLDDIGV
ncbi:MAG: hypothetical protein LBT20_02155 [Clostridiales bacterium]|jgi:hypothetical protein|nr:hypothetical protein [Clostridiales bacterium]